MGNTVDSQCVNSALPLKKLTQSIILFSKNDYESMLTSFIVRIIPF